MTNPRTIWLVRHGNRQDFVDPQWRDTAERPHDPGLSPDGLVQAKEVARRIASEQIDHMFASPYLRTVQTAHLIAKALGLPIKLEHGISEYLNPKWFSQQPELLPLEVLTPQFPQLDSAYRSRRFAQFPETDPGAMARAGETARHLAAEFSGNLLFIGHGASVLGATRGLLQHKIDFAVPLCSLVKLVQQDQGWVPELIADISHLSQSETKVRLN